MSAINQKIRRLPGFRFEAQTATREDVLPRMDVALFVGFAATGPIGIPVALESAEQFKLIFGDNLPLVWNQEKGEMIHAFLAPSVRMFFRNGGKRCWVIRTARIEADEKKPLNRAAYNFFPLTGLAGIRFDGDDPSEIIPAFAWARSKGSWSDDLRIATATVSTALKFKKLEDSAEGKVLRVETSANDPVKTGDLLRLDFPNSDLNLILMADKIEPDEYVISSPAISPTFGKLNLKITSKRFVWMQDLPKETFPKPQNIQIKMWTRQNALDLEDISKSALSNKQAEISFEKGEKDILTGEAQTKVDLKFSNISLADIPAEGSLLVTEFLDKLLCLQVESVINAKTEDQQIVNLICNGVFIIKNAVQFLTSPDVVPDVERLSFEIWIKKGEKTLTKLNDLAFDPAHERFWGNLFIDDDFYSFSENENPNSPDNPTRSLTREFPHSPIAGNGDRDGFFIPVFPNALIGNYLGAIELQGTKLQRDGLEVFDERLFLDEKLKNTGLNNLLTDAEFIRYLSLKPRRLWGIHAALAPETLTTPSAESTPANPAYASFSLDEATIIAVPDALHHGWFQDINEGLILSPPAPFEPPLRPEWWRFQNCRTREIEPVEKPLWGNFLNCNLKIIKPPKDFQVEENDISDGTFTLFWKHDADNKNLKFVLEESATSEFDFPQEIYRNKKKQFEVRNHGAGIFYYRVRAEIGGAVSNWSKGLGIKIPAAENWTAEIFGRN